MNSDTTTTFSPAVDVAEAPAQQDLVLIRRTKGSGMASKDAKYYRPEYDAYGKLVRTHVSNYDKEQLPLTRQTEIIFWHAEKQQYTFDIDDDTLNALVVKCGFSYPEKYVAKMGEKIKECNRYDRNDAFVYMMNREAKFQKEEGEGKLDKSVARQAVMASHLATRGNYLTPKSSSDPNLNNAIYDNMIVSTTHETHSKYTEFQLLEKTNTIWSKLDDRMKRDIAKLCHLAVTANTSHEVLGPALYEYATSKEPSKERGMTKQQHFIHLAELSGDDFQFELAIHMANLKNILKLAGPLSAQYYTLFNTPVGSNKEQVREYLRNPENQETWTRLLLLLKNN